MNPEAQETTAPAPALAAVNNKAVEDADVSAAAQTSADESSGVKDLNASSSAAAKGGSSEPADKQGTSAATTASVDGERKRIVLIGTTGAGKSTFGNALLGLKTSCHESSSEQGFQMSSGARSCTEVTSALDGFWMGDESRPIRVIDTPGHGDSEGRDSALRKSMVDCMKEERYVHVFIWVKNSQSPRFDKQDKEFYDIFKEMFGPGFVDNLVIVLTRFSFSPAWDRIRKRTGESLDRIMDEIQLYIYSQPRMIPAFANAAGAVSSSNSSSEKGTNCQRSGDSISPTCADELSQKSGKVLDGAMAGVSSILKPPQILIFALDALHDPEDSRETKKYNKYMCKLWESIQKFGLNPVENIKMVKDHLARLSQEIENMKSQQEEKDRLYAEHLQSLEAEKKLILQASEQDKERLEEIEVQLRGQQEMFTTLSNRLEDKELQEKLLKDYIQKLEEAQDRKATENKEEYEKLQAENEKETRRLCREQEKLREQMEELKEKLEMDGLRRLMEELRRTEGHYAERMRRLESKKGGSWCSIS